MKYYIILQHVLLINNLFFIIILQWLYFMNIWFSLCWKHFSILIILLCLFELIILLWIEYVLNFLLYLIILIILIDCNHYLYDFGIIGNNSVIFFIFLFYLNFLHLSLYILFEKLVYFVKYVTLLLSEWILFLFFIYLYVSFYGFFLFVSKRLFSFLFAIYKCPKSEHVIMTGSERHLYIGGLNLVFCTRWYRNICLGLILGFLFVCELKTLVFNLNYNLLSKLQILHT